jgi:3-phosphoshikimate 1-carboxyvinyltransferase
MPQPDASSRTITPARWLSGRIRVPGDKSISHRYALLGALAEGVTGLRGFASSADCQSTLNCLSGLGVRIERMSAIVKIHGRGLDGLAPPVSPLDAGNSGSTMRMLAGILAGQRFKSRLVGDGSLSRRPMKRIIDPLAQMGARIASAPGGLPPLEIEGHALTAICYQPPVASAQVKTAVLLAGLLAEGQTTVLEPAATRDHTEIALEQMGAFIERHNGIISICGGGKLNPVSIEVPGDISSAAFFIAAALMFPNSEIILEHTGLNTTRTPMLHLLKNMGARIEIEDWAISHGEPAGNIRVTSGPLEGGEIPVEAIPGLIDELPVLAVLGTRMRRGLSFHGATELRVKESDRLAAVAANLRRMQVDVEEFPDGLRVPGEQTLRQAEVESYGDHRIAMAFAIAGLAAEGETVIHGADCVGISFPEFFDSLEAVAVRN